MNRIMVLDIETWGLSATPEAFALGVIFDGETFHRFIDRQVMIDWIFQSKNRGKIIFAHNGGNYDYLCLFGNLMEYFGKDCLMADSNFIMAEKVIRKRTKKSKVTGKDTSHNESIKFYDSFNIIKSSVGLMGEQLNYEKGITPLKFKIGRKQEGLEEQDFIYCERDCAIVYKFLIGIFSEVGDIKPTIASCSMYYWRTQFQKETLFVDYENDELWRRCLFGGRTEAFHIGNVEKFNLKVYDINSLYPYVMATKNYPSPNKYYIKKSRSVKQLLSIMDEFEGFAAVKVNHFKRTWGLIPSKDETIQKLVFKSGVYWAIVPFPELRFGLDNGLEILEVKEIVFSKRIKSPFHDYIMKLYNRRKVAPEPEKTVLKYLMNSLFGKFGEKSHSKDIYTVKYSKREHNRLKNEYGRTVNWKPIKPFSDEGYYEIEPESDYMPNTVISWPCYVTSWGRVELMKWFQEVERLGGTVYYCDTDSVFIDIDLPTTGKELGQMKLENKRIQSIFAPKNYIQDNKEIIKGVPKKRITIKVIQTYKRIDGKLVEINQHLKKKNIFSYKNIVKSRSSIRRKKLAGASERVIKKPTRKYDKRQVMEDGTTRIL